MLLTLLTAFKLVKSRKVVICQRESVGKEGRISVRRNHSAVFEKFFPLDSLEIGKNGKKRQKDL